MNTHVRPPVCSLLPTFSTLCSILLLPLRLDMGHDTFLFRCAYYWLSFLYGFPLHLLILFCWFIKPYSIILFFLQVTENLPLVTDINTERHYYSTTALVLDGPFHLFHVIVLISPPTDEPHYSFPDIPGTFYFVEHPDCPCPICEPATYHTEHLLPWWDDRWHCVCLGATCLF